MTKISPFIKCVDYWKEKIPPEKLDAYRALIHARLIKKHHVLVNRQTGVTIVEYSSTVPHEWIREELKKISEGK